MKPEHNIYFNKFPNFSSSETYLEQWILRSERRNKRKGYRAARYIEDPKSTDLMWDEHYMFFSSLDDAYSAFINGDLTDGRARF